MFTCDCKSNQIFFSEQWVLVQSNREASSKKSRSLKSIVNIQYQESAPCSSCTLELDLLAGQVVILIVLGSWIGPCFLPLGVTIRAFLWSGLRTGVPEVLPAVGTHDGEVGIPQLVMLTNVRVFTLMCIFFKKICFSPIIQIRQNIHHNPSS